MLNSRGLEAEDDVLIELRVCLERALKLGRKPAPTQLRVLRVIEALQHNRVGGDDGEHRLLAGLRTVWNEPEFILSRLLGEKLAFLSAERIFGALHFGTAARGFFF